MATELSDRFPSVSENDCIILVSFMGTNDYLDFEEMYTVLYKTG